MNEKELIQKLNSLKNLTPDNDWKSHNREVLLSQISRSASDDEAGIFTFIENLIPEKIMMLASKPAMVFAMIVVFVLGGGVYSLKAARETKPGDSLYIAKIISEKTQLALTFDQTKKAKLNLEFAGNRTKEIAKMIEGKNENDKDSANTTTIRDLTDDFKKELTAAKTRLAQVGGQKTAAVNKPKIENNIVDNNEEIKVYGAGAEKDTSGMQISGFSSSLQSLSEAEKLFEEQDYQGTLTKIDEISKNIDNPESTAAKTVPAKATSTVKDTATSTK